MTGTQHPRPDDVEAGASSLAAAPTVVDLSTIAASDAWWHSCALSALRWLAADGYAFEAADVARLGVPDPDRPERWGALFAAALRLGIIEPAGYAGSRRAEAWGRPVRVWRGVRT